MQKISVFSTRQQREELTRKKEKMESMLKGKKSQTGVARPESPSSRRRRSLRRTTMPTRRLASNSRSAIDVRNKVLTLELLCDETNDLGFVSRETSDKPGQPPRLISLRKLGSLKSFKCTVMTDQTRWIPKLIRVFTWFKA